MNTNSSTWRMIIGIIGGIALIPIVGCCCLYLLINSEDIEGDIGRWIKSFEFPAIEARYKPIGDEIAKATQDTLLKEEHRLNNITLMTRRPYTGCVRGVIDRIYGTNRDWNNVLADYAKLFSPKPDWKQRQNGENFQPKLHM